MLFKQPPKNTFFARFLQGKSCCTIELKTPSENVGPKLLPTNFLLQIDNYVKDNKNRYLVVFLSLLMTREMFEEVKLGFLVFGHTHEEINGCFGYLSKKVEKEKQLYFGKFDEGFHGFVRDTFHSIVD